MIKIGREVAALRKFVYPDRADRDRAYLCGVYIDGEKGEAWATNGAIAVAVPLERQDFEDPTFKTVIPADFLARIPDGVDWPVTLRLNDDAVRGQEVEAVMTVGTAVTLTMRCQTLGQKFPNVRGIVPKAGERPCKAVFNAEYLRAFFDLAARHNRNSFSSVSVEFEAGPEVTQTARLTFLLSDGRRVECAAAQIKLWAEEVAYREGAAKEG